MGSSKSTEEIACAWHLKWGFSSTKVISKFVLPFSAQTILYMCRSCAFCTTHLLFYHSFRWSPLTKTCVSAFITPYLKKDNPLTLFKRSAIKWADILYHSYLLSDVINACFFTFAMFACLPAEFHVGTSGEFRKHHQVQFILWKGYCLSGFFVHCSDKFLKINDYKWTYQLISVKTSLSLSLKWRQLCMVGIDLPGRSLLLQMNSHSCSC